MMDIDTFSHFNRGQRWRSNTWIQIKHNRHEHKQENVSETLYVNHEQSYKHMQTWNTNHMASDIWYVYCSSVRFPFLMIMFIIVDWFEIINSMCCGTHIFLYSIIWEDDLGCEREREREIEKEIYTAYIIDKT